MLIGIWPIAVTEQKQKSQNHIFSDFQCLTFTETI
jgi:hypothetical protein